MVSAGEIVKALKVARSEEYEKILLDFIKTELIKILDYDVDFEIHPQQPLMELGVDSFMIVKLRNQILAEFGSHFVTALPNTVIYSNPTLNTFLAILLGEIVPSLINGDRGLDNQTSEAQEKEKEKEKKTPSEGLQPKDIAFWRKRIFPTIKKFIKLKYLTCEVSGQENIPKTGSVVYVANHAGWGAFDSLVFAFVLDQRLKLKTIPYFAVADILVKLLKVGGLATKLGFIPASHFLEPESLAADLNQLLMFPEGTAGYSKPFWKAYQMAKWKTGFIRFSISHKSKVVPVSIIGSEESFPVLFSTRLFEKLTNSPVAIPIIPIPLPAKWKIIFHKPIDLSEVSSDLVNDHGYCSKKTDEIRNIVQETLNKETKDRTLRRLSSWISAKYNLLYKISLKDR